MMQVEKLKGAAGLARGDLALSIQTGPKYLHWRWIQTIRMITNALDDAEKFKQIWERWMTDQSGEHEHTLPTFEQLMDKDYPSHTYEG